MRKFFGSIGSVSRVTIESQALKSNMLGDPPVRVVDVYVPAGHDGQGLPLRAALRMWRYRAARRVWQELRRVWRNHARAAPLRHLVGRGLSFRRYGLRVVLSAGHASGPARTRRR